MKFPKIWIRICILFDFFDQFKPESTNFTFGLSFKLCSSTFNIYYTTSLIKITFILDFNCSATLNPLILKPWTKGVCNVFTKVYKMANFHCAFQFQTTFFLIGRCRKSFRIRFLGKKTEKNVSNSVSNFR